MRAVGPVSLLAPLLPLAAAAQEPAPLPIRAGGYLFTTFAQVNGRPVCAEYWEFAADGALTVFSGHEEVRKRWSLETDRDGMWLVTETVSGNGEPDCMGIVTAKYTPAPRRTYLFVQNNGFMQLCPAPAHMADGAPFIADCYARLVPAEEAG